MGAARPEITWTKSLLWSALTGLVLVAMFSLVLLGWRWLNPGDPFLATLGAYGVGLMLAAIFAATFGTMFYWFTFLLADRRQRDASDQQRRPPV